MAASLRRSGARRAVPGVALIIVVVVGISGCQIAVDDFGSEVIFSNAYSESLNFAIVDPEGQIDTEVWANSSVAYALRECRGDSIRVETLDGEVLGEIDRPACPGWRVRVGPEGELSYVDEND
ncbi:hypothetical protein [Demequina sp.]|uniref:hypothetical protein n=1 Tax=Demequina sp. TaxID=2050685 RepID=UPI003D1090DB